MATCPNCGSDKFHYELRSNGTYGRSNYYRYRRRRSFIFPAGSKTYASVKKDKVIGFCPNCGYTQEKNKEDEEEFSGWGLVAVVCGIVLLIAASKNVSSVALWVLGLAVFVLVMMYAISNKQG